jgi:hypothetical protein
MLYSAEIIQPVPKEALGLLSSRIPCKSSLLGSLTSQKVYRYRLGLGGGFGDPRYGRSTGDTE